MQREDEKFNSKYEFIDNKKDCSKLLYVLAGYKPLLWENVFGRIKRFCPKDVDVCIISSGIFSEKLKDFCIEYDWSYLSTEINKLTIAQNITISLFPKAELIFKMDEDVFLTEHFWEYLEETFGHYDKMYRIGFVGPLMPLHNYGFYQYLELKGYEKEWKQYAPQFSKLKIGGHSKDDNAALYSDEIADFVWDKCEQIDKEALEFRNMNLEPKFVNMRFPICAIMFRRKFWEKMGGFEVGVGNGGGSDEEQMVKFCAVNSYFVLCDIRMICYHFGFYYQEHILYRKYRVFKEKFELNIGEEKTIGL